MGAGPAEPGRHGGGPDDGLGGQVVADPAVDAVGDERLDHRHQPWLGQVADGVGAGLRGWARSRGPRGRSGAASCRPGGPSGAIASASYAVNRSSISKVVPARPPRFIEPMTTLPSSAPRSSRSSIDVGGAEHAVDPGADERDGRAGRAARQRSAIASGVGRRRAARRAPGGRRRPASAARSRRSARRDDDALAGDARRSGRAAAPGSRPGRRRRCSRDPLQHAGRARRSSAWRRHRPADRRRRRRRRWRTGASARASQPARSPWHSAPPKASPGAEAVDDLHRHRRHDDVLAAADPEHAGRTLLDDGEVDAGVEQSAAAARSGSRSPTATSHSSRLPTATSTRSTAARTCRWASSGELQNIGR